MKKELYKDEEVKYELSDLDRKIVNSLVENARLSLRQIAKKIHVSVATVMHHLRQLEMRRIIKKYATNIDYDKVGYDVEVVIEIRVSKGKLFEVEKKIATHPNVFAVYDLTGPFDSLVLARFKSRRELDTFVKKLQSFEFVERTETKLILNTIKEEDRMPE